MQVLHDLTEAADLRFGRIAAVASMATVTGPEQHGGLSGMTYSMTSTQPFGLVSEDELSPCSPLFPEGQPSHILSGTTPGPLPNPPFVFPARPSPSSAPSSMSRATGRRPRSAYELQGGASGFARESQIGAGRSLPPPLPSFSFNAMTSSALDTGMNSPPLSPQSPQSTSSTRSIPSRPGGHRRGGSEFIGGDGMTGTGMGLMSTSPTKGDGVLPSPNTTSSLGPSAGRRGHAHRRSAAISCHDLSMILKPQSPNLIIGGSAPTSPSDKEYHQMSFPGLDSAIQPSVPIEEPRTEAEGMTSPPDSPRRASNRARVGFSDTIEFIPRPLSLVSSDTSSTTTMRPGHSVSNSLSSVMSSGAASPPTKDRGITPGHTNTHKRSDSRPSTAGAVLGSVVESTVLSGGTYSLRRRSSLPLTPDDSLIDLDTATKPLPKKYFFFGHETAPREGSPTESRPVSSSSEKTKSPLSSSAPSSPSLESPDIPVASTEVDVTPVRKTSLTRKQSKKGKKVKSWAGILGRKPRQRSQKQKGLNRRSPTPPLRSFEQTSPAEDVSATFIEDTVPATVEENPHSPGIAKLETDFASWKPRHITTHDDESMSPIIDLDAALGPFNTPSGYDPAWEASQRGSAGTKRRMHSAATGPYHRRAESAPEMVPFANPRAGLHHIGSRSTMEDVFEEDEEEDEWEELKTVSHKGSKTPIEDDDDTPDLGIDIKVVDAGNTNTENVMDWTIDSSSSIQRGVKRKGSGLSESERRQVSSSTKSDQSIGSDTFPVVDDNGSLKISEYANDSRPTSSRAPSESSPTPPLHPSTGREHSKPVDIQPIMWQQPYLTPNSPMSSSHSPFPSPRSPMSYDAQRISTAPSSFTDEQGFQSLLLGEPGPEIRMSVDDVPSLTSSNSTMTRESGINPALNNPQFRGGQRSASLSSPSITRKRSSIASLSRLLTSSHGEKSKLSIEERAPSSPEKKDKGGKGKRLSRMMQFWKPKDESGS